MKCSKLVFCCSKPDATMARGEILIDFNSCEEKVILHSLK